MRWPEMCLMYVSPAFSRAIFTSSNVEADDGEAAPRKRLGQR